MRKIAGPVGATTRVVIESEALKGNLLGDVSARAVDVYVPTGCDSRELPLLVDLVGFTGSGLSHTNWVGFQENVPERLDRLIDDGRMPPVVVAFPDCFTRLGGNQYINSVAMGAWEDFLLVDMLPAIESRFGCGGEGRRGVFGKSSGGYGAITHALRHADVWAAAACHSGDMGFELCYLPEMPAVLRALAKVDVLAIDELGYLNIKSEQTNIFFKLMEERHHRRPTLITTNLPYPSWQDFLGNKALTKALLSRLRERCHTVTIDGPCLRAQQG